MDRQVLLKGGVESLSRVHCMPFTKIFAYQVIFTEFFLSAIQTQKNLNYVRKRRRLPTWIWGFWQLSEAFEVWTCVFLFPCFRQAHWIKIPGYPSGPA